MFWLYFVAAEKTSGSRLTGEKWVDRQQSKKRVSQQPSLAFILGR
jgi:hypothetical protein